MDRPEGTVANPTGALLARNTVLNVSGVVAPLVVALIAIPFLTSGLGTDRFGLLTLAWVFIGYFSLFDLGMSRALTQLVSEKLGSERDAEIPAVVWTALIITLAIGVAACVLAVLITPWLIQSLLNVPSSLHYESIQTFYALAASLPLVITTAALRGILQAVQRFDVVNAIRVPLGAFTFGGPLLVLPFTQSLFVIVLVLVAGRFAAWLAHLVYVLRLVPGVGRAMAFEFPLIGTLLRLGGWMTVSNLVSPLMVYMDRFLIGSVLTVSAVAFYATPWEVATKLLVLPAAFAGVLFPAFGFWQGRDRQESKQLFERALKYTALALCPLGLLLVAFAEPGLRLWLDGEFAREGFRPLQILTIGVFLNGVAAIPFALIQGSGRPDVTARLHLAELPLYAAALFFLTKAYGITGAALAWSLRVAFDFAFLVVASQRTILKAAIRRETAVFLFVSVVVLSIGMLPSSLEARVAFALVSLTVYGILSWKVYVLPDEKQFLQERLARGIPWV